MILIIKVGDVVTIDNPNSLNAKWGVVVDIICDIIYVKWENEAVDTIFEDEIKAIQINLNIK